MGSPTTTTGPTNVYRCIDDTVPNTNPLTVNGPGSGGTGQPVCPDFTAPSIASAYTVAYLLSSVLQRPVRLVPIGTVGPYTLVVGAAPTVGLTQVPSGIAY
jgi:hypothetical protein